MDTDARGDTRPAAFRVPDTPLGRPATPRQPFMPSPKKRPASVVPLRRKAERPLETDHEPKPDNESAPELPAVHTPPVKRAAPPKRQLTPHAPASRPALSETARTNMRTPSPAKRPERLAPRLRERPATPARASPRVEQVRAPPRAEPPRTRTPLRTALSAAAPRAKVPAGGSGLRPGACSGARSADAALPARAFVREHVVDVEAAARELGDSSFVLEDGVPDEADSVHVHVRVRPSEDGEESAWIVARDSAALMLDPAVCGSRQQASIGVPFHFDAVHTGSSNAAVYASLARPLVHSVLGGYDAMVFAYGQTASGKTFTLTGSEDGAEPGIIARAVSDVFEGIRQDASAREYIVRVSYLEIWNEVVRDLLDPDNAPQVRDDRRRGPHAVLVAPLHEAVAQSPSAVYALLARGEANRHVGATDWNERSSRSHTCFRISVQSRERGVAPHVRVGELSLVDLAGSEKHTMHGAQRRTEGANINRSLLTLGKVIYALSERSAGRAGAHVPFRDSKLTRILQNSLSGHARVAVVCTLNPSAAAVEESLSTLGFARRIKHVAVRAQRNEWEDGDARALLVSYREEMGALRARVAQLQGEGVPAAGDQLRALRERIDELGALIRDDEPGPAPPPSPVKDRGLDFAEPVHVVQEKLHAALLKIRRLERRLAARLSLPPGAHTDSGKDELIRDLQRQVRELETVCDAQAVDAPPLLREDVEREWAAKFEHVEQRAAEREAFIAELSAECARLQRANRQLVRLAHRETDEMVAALAPPPRQPVMSLFAPHLRQCALGMPGSAPATPLAPRHASLSIDSDDPGDEHIAAILNVQ